MNKQTQGKVADGDNSGNDSIDNGSNSGENRNTPILPNSDNSQEQANLDGKNSDEKSHEDLVKEIEALKTNNSKLEDSRRTLQSRTDVLTEQIVKNSQEASRLGLNVDDRGMPTESKPPVSQKPSGGEDDEAKFSRIIDEKMQTERKANLEEKIRADVLEHYPDLKNPESELYKEAEKVLAERPHLNSAFALRDLAQIAIFNLMQSNQPEIEKQVKAKFFSREATSAAFATASSSGFGGSGGDQNDGLTEEQRSYYKGKRDLNDKEIKRLEKVMQNRNKKGAFILDV